MWWVQLAILVVSVAATMLLTPSNKQKPEKQTQNTSLRGQIMPVTFGTNRVGANIVWLKNFSYVMKKSKSKGSSGLSSTMQYVTGWYGLAPGSNEGYEYYEDAIFHYGMFDTPAIATRGWVGASKLKSATVQAITGTAPPAGIKGIFVNNTTSDSDSLTMKWDDVFYAPGYATSSPSLASWSYLTAQEGVEVTWPSTVWVGFKKLVLGSSPVLPQLSFEFASDYQFPIETVAYCDPDPTHPIGGTDGHSFVMVGTDGNHYYFFDSNDGVHTFPTLTCVETGLTRHLDDAWFYGLASVALTLTGAESAYGNQVILPTKGQPYFFALKTTGVNQGTPYDLQLEVPVLRLVINSLTNIQVDGATMALRTNIPYILLTDNCLNSAIINGKVVWYAQAMTYGPDDQLLSLSLTSAPVSTSWESNFVASGVVGYLNWVPTTASSDVPMAYIVYRILTNPTYGFATQSLFGFAVTDDRVDQASYRDALNYCWNEGYMVSVTYSSSDSLLSVLAELTGMYGGYLVEVGGKIYFGVIRAEDEPIRVIDNSHLVPEKEGSPPVNVAKPALEDCYNKIEYGYLDRNLNYDPNQVYVSDEVDMDLNGPRAQTIDAKYAMAGSLALKIATKALWQNLYSSEQYTFMLGWKDADLCGGSLITLVDSFTPVLRQGVRARIYNWKEVQPGKFQVIAQKELSHFVNPPVKYTSQNSSDNGMNSLSVPVVPTLWNAVYELPQEFDTNARMYIGYVPGSYILGAQLYVSRDGASYEFAGNNQHLPTAGILAAPMPERPKGFVENNVEFYINPVSGFSVATPLFTSSVALDDATTALRSGGKTLLRVGSEMVALEHLTLLGQNHYRTQFMYRGWGGSPISAHNSGEYFFAHDNTLFFYDLKEDDIGGQFSIKVVPYNYAGDAYSIASLDATTYTVRGTFWLPRQQPITRMYVPSALTAVASVPVVGPYVQVAPGGSDLILGWPNAYNKDGYGQGGFGSGLFGHVGVNEGNSYRVEVSSKNGTLVSSYVVNTGYFAYTLAQNSTDFNGFGRDLIVRVVPFNTKGDGPVADVRSISMNW